MEVLQKIPFIITAFCLGFILLTSSSFQNVIEICDNGIDDDLDGSIDLNDDECTCHTFLLRSTIPNHSFESMNCCPDAQDKFECVNSWIKASGPTTDYINTCDFTGNPDIQPPFPFPDGNGIAGFRDGVEFEGNIEENWKEYVGTCLLEPLMAGEDYFLIFNLGFINSMVSPPFDFTLYGHISCSAFPFGDIDIGCPLNALDWVELSSIYLDGGSGNVWIEDTLYFTASQKINAIVMGPSCIPTTAANNTYYYLDKLILDEQLALDLQIKSLRDPCNPDFSLHIPYKKEHSYQWYRNGTAILGETNNLIQTNGIRGTYAVRIVNKKGCFLSENYVYRIPETRSFPDVTICEAGSYVFGGRILTNQGTYVDTIFREANCDSIVSLNLFVQEVSESNITVRILPGEEYKVDGRSFTNEGNYTYIIPSSIGCDSIIHLTVEFMYINFPNIFSPNGDGVNDLFQFNGDLSELEFIEITIIDRWGNNVFKGKTWDGTFEGKNVTHGVYLYVANIRLINGSEAKFSGSVMVVH